MSETKTGQKVKSVAFAAGDIKTMIQWLNIPLHSQKARSRNRIVDILTEKFDVFEADRIVLIEKFAKKDDKNEFVKIPDGMGGKKYDFDPENLEAFQKEYGPMSEEKIVFDVLPSNIDHWRVVKKIFEDTKIEMDVETTKFWEKILAEFDNIK